MSRCESVWVGHAGRTPEATRVALVTAGAPTVLRGRAETEACAEHGAEGKALRPARAGDGRAETAGHADRPPAGVGRPPEQPGS